MNLFGQQNQASEKGITRISGKIENYDKSRMSNKAVVSYFDYLKSKSIDYESPISNTGDFDIYFPLNDTQDLYVSAINIIDLIVSPGDKIYLTVNASLSSNKIEFLKNTKINGDHSRLNRQLLTYNISDIPGKHFMNNRENLDPNKFKRQLDSVMPIRKAYIENFIKENKIESQLKDWLIAQKEFEYHYMFYQYPTYYRLFNYKLPTIDSTFYENILPIPKIKKQHLINTLVSYRLPISYISGIKPNIDIRIDNYSQNDIVELKKIVSLENGENLLFKQLAFYHVINHNMNSNDISFYEANNSCINSFFQDSILSEQLIKNYNLFKERISNIKFPTLNIKNSQFFLETIKKENPKKVIYIDHWATWCLPCLITFKNYEVFQEQFGNNVVYIFVAHQSNYKEWREIVLDFGLKGQHYFISESKEESFFGGFNIQGFPTYTIINNQGEVVKSGLDYSPEKDETKALLLKLIKE